MVSASLASESTTRGPCSYERTGGASAGRSGPRRDRRAPVLPGGPHQGADRRGAAALPVQGGAPHRPGPLQRDRPHHDRHAGCRRHRAQRAGPRAARALRRALVVNTDDDDDATGARPSPTSRPRSSPRCSPRRDVLGLGWSRAVLATARAAHAGPRLHGRPDDRGPDQPGRHREPDRRRRRPRPPRRRPRLLVLRAACSCPTRRAPRSSAASRRRRRRSPASPTLTHAVVGIGSWQPVRSRPARRAHRRRARGVAPRGRARRPLRHVPRRRGHPAHDAAVPPGDRDQRRAARRRARRRSASPTAGSARPPCAPPSARATSPRSSPPPHLLRSCSRIGRLTMSRRLDRKLDAILAGRYTPDDFIIADAKDADMAFGVAAPGPSRAAAPHAGDLPGQHARAGRGRRARHPAHLGLQRRAAGVRRLARRRGHARRAGQRHHRHLEPPRQQLHRRAVAPVPHRRSRRRPPVLRPRAVLGDVQQRHRARPRHPRGLQRVPRARPPSVGMRYFLEVFNPNAPVDLAPEDVGAFVNDAIIRTLAGRHHGAPTAVPQDGLQRGRRAGRARGARPVGGGRASSAVRRAPRATRSSCSTGPSGTAPGWRCSAARSSARSRSWTSSG